MSVVPLVTLLPFALVCFHDALHGYQSERLCEEGTQYLPHTIPFSVSRTRVQASGNMCNRRN